MNSSKQAKLLTDRYGSGTQPENMVWNPVIEQLLSHRSVRHFLPGQPLPAGTLETITAAAQSASTSSNQHLWSLVAVTDPQLKEEVVDLTRGRESGVAQDFARKASAILLWVADTSRNLALLQEAGTPAENMDYLDTFLAASVDAALAAQNALVAAESLGLGGVYLGSMRNNARQIAELVNLPAGSYVVFGMALGTPDPAAPAAGVRPRPPQRAVLHHNTYQPAENWVEDYEQATEQFRAAYGMKSKTWRSSLAATSAKSYSDGREELRQTLEERGFGFQ